MIFKSRRYVKSVLLSVLRQYFTTHAKFPYKENIHQTKIFIDEQFPEIQRKYPCIIISDASSPEFFKPAFDRGFQDESYETQSIDGINRDVSVGSRYGMPLDSVIKIEIKSMNPFMGETIADDVATFILYTGYFLFKKAGIEIKSASAQDPQIEIIGNDNVTTYVITLNTYSEWEQFVTTEESDIVQGITIPDINGLITENPDGTTNSIF